MQSFDQEVRVNTIDVLDAMEKHIDFGTRPTVVYPELRPVWRISLVALIVGFSKPKTGTSLALLHVLDWMLRTSSAIPSATLGGLSSPEDELGGIPRLDPSLNRAVNLMCAAGVLQIDSKGLVGLTESGTILYTSIMDAPQLFEREKERLAAILPLLSSKKVNEILHGLKGTQG